MMQCRVDTEYKRLKKQGRTFQQDIASTQMIPMREHKIPESSQNTKMNMQ
jgi:hypothetical protein